jgi:BirA family biotin operon repressor/biotin-[acetyl-CoA-carboxylase] ligase
LVIIATKQTQGRGRNQRVWLSPEGSLCFSLLCPAPRDQRFTACAGLIAALALADAIVSTTVKLHPAIKWPNDLLLNDKKVAGILSEYIADKGRVIIGVGLNLNCKRADLPPDLDFPATTVHDELGKPVVAMDLLQSFLNNFRSQMSVLDAMGFGSARMVIESRLAFLGERVEFALSEKEKIKGKLIGIDDTGQLLVELDSGIRRAFISGDLLRPQLN